MNIAPVLVAAELVTFHSVDGRTVTINPDTITTISQAREDDHEKKLLAGGVNCVLHFVDGGYVTTRETCAQVLNAIVDAQPKRSSRGIDP